MFPNVISIGLFLIIIWLAVLSYFFYKLVNHYRILTAYSDNKSLKSILEEVVRDSHNIKKDIATLTAGYDKIESEGKLHIQKIGLLRFNPFKDTGGDQSFIVALIDANDTGIVISGLYSRSGTRWYAKQVVKGKGMEHDLSEEEKKAIRIAKSTG